MTNAAVRLNVGCGTDYRKGYINCDIDATIADLVFDLNQLPYPFSPDSVDEIVANQVLEHVINLPAVMDGLHAILKPGGILKVVVPHFTSYGAMGHYDHKTTFHYNSFAWCDLNANKTDMLHYTKLWRMNKRELRFAIWPQWLSDFVVSPLFNRHKNLYTTTGLAYLFPARLIWFEFEKPTQDEEAQARSRLRTLIGAKAGRWRAGAPA